MNTFIAGDAEQCIGCQACMIACACAHENIPVKELVEQRVPFHSRVTVINVPEVTVPVQCRQCEDSPCAQACPVNAIVQQGSHVEVIKDRCIGCKSCVLACPFGAIKVEEDPACRAGVLMHRTDDTHQDVEKSLFIVEKCDLCAHAGQPACVAICPAKALHLIDPETIQRKITSRRHQAASQLGHYQKGFLKTVNNGQPGKSSDASCQQKQ